MRIKKFLVLLITFSAIVSANAQAKKYALHTVAFYNLENLFDTINQPNFDEEWLPNGKQNWTSKKYKQKLQNLARVLSEIGINEQQKEMPVVIGAVEIENRGVLEDLVKQPKLIPGDYGIVHYESPDKRGIDVGLLYRKKHFKPTSSINIPLMIYKDMLEKDKGKPAEKSDDDADDKIEVTADNRVYTRDILLVTGLLDGEEVSFIVNHWPSRSGGEKRSSPYREAAGKLARKIIDSLYKINPDAKIMTMGDFNDGSYNKSIKQGLGAKQKKSEVSKFGIFNPFEQMYKDGHATLFWRDTGDIFDQIMVTEPMIREGIEGFRYWKAGIFNKPYLIQKSGQYKGYPLRNTLTQVGFSDHFPVYIYLVREVK
jgi:hypothetical protein